MFLIKRIIVDWIPYYIMLAGYGWSYKKLLYSQRHDAHGAAHHLFPQRVEAQSNRLVAELRLLGIRKNVCQRSDRLCKHEGCAPQQR